MKRIYGMARIRYIKPAFFSDADVASLPYATQKFYCGLWCWADKAGRLHDKPLELKAQILPYDPKADGEKMLQELATAKSSTEKPFILRYEVGGCRYIQIVKFLDHQRPHHTEADSVIPPPHGDLTVNGALLTSDLTGRKLKGNGEGKLNKHISPAVRSLAAAFCEEWKKVHPTAYVTDRTDFIQLTRLVKTLSPNIPASETWKGVLRWAWLSGDKYLLAQSGSLRAVAAAYPKLIAKMNPPKKEVPKRTVYTSELEGVIPGQEKKDGS